MIIAYCRICVIPLIRNRYRSPSPRSKYAEPPRAYRDTPSPRRQRPHSRSPLYRRSSSPRTAAKTRRSERARSRTRSRSPSRSRRDHRSEGGLSQIGLMAELRKRQQGVMALGSISRRITFLFTLCDVIAGKESPQPPPPRETPPAERHPESRDSHNASREKLRDAAAAPEAATRDNSGKRSSRSDQTNITLNITKRPADDGGMVESITCKVTTGSEEYDSRAPAPVPPPAAHDKKADSSADYVFRKKDSSRSREKEATQQRKNGVQPKPRASQMPMPPVEDMSLESDSR